MNKHPPDLPENIKEFFEDFEKIETEYMDYMTRVFLIPADKEDIWKSKNLAKKDTNLRH